MPFSFRNSSILSISRWPDWKNKKNASSYESPKILGKMFRKMNESLDAIGNNDCKDTCEFEVPDKIVKLLIDYDDVDMKKIVPPLLKEYIQHRASSSHNMDHRNFFKWKKNYLTDVRKKFVLDKKNPNKVALLDAAFIYKICLIEERKDKSSRACEFAWGVCFDEIIDIFSGENKISVSCEAQQYVLK